MVLMRPLKSVKSDLNSIFDEMDTIFRPFLNTSHPEIQEHLNSWYPLMDVTENEHDLRLEAAIPGYESSEIDVEVDRHTVTITGEKAPVEHQEEKVKYLLKEMVSGRFSRKVQLPCEVLAEKSKAEFKNGVLTLTLPKAVQTKKLKININ